MVGRGGHGARRARLGARAADAPPQPAHRRGAACATTRAPRPRSGSTRASSRARSSRGSCCSCAPTVRAGRGLELAVREHEVLAEAGEGLHTSGVVAVYDASRTLSTRVLRELVEQHLPRTDAIADPLPVGVRLGRRLPLRRDAIAALHAPPTPEETRSREPTGWPTRSCCCCSSRSPSGARGAPAGGAARQARRAAPRATTPRSRSRSRRARSAACATSTATSRARPPDAPAAARRRRLGQDRRGGARDAARRRARRPGRRCWRPPRCSSSSTPRRCAALVEPLGIEVAVVTGDLPAAERRARLQRIASGDAALVVGTHALLEASVEFERLRVIVVDEQHRFGVEQRAALSEGHGAHALHMTATPIPRSLALSLYGDLDLTELRELPAGRQPIITRRVPAAKRAGLPRLARQGVAGARPPGLRRVRARGGLRDRAGARGRGAARRARQGARAAQRRARARAAEGRGARRDDARVRRAPRCTCSSPRR